MAGSIEVGSLVPAAEAAQQAGISREVMVRRIQSGKIRGARVAGRWLVHADALQQLIATSANRRD